MTHTALSPAVEAPGILPGALPAPVRELLTAIVEALDVPLADRPVDDQARAELLTRRASDTRVIVELLLAHGHLAHSARRLREWTAEHPVAYPTWQARTTQSAGEQARGRGEDGEGKQTATAPHEGRASDVCKPLYGAEADRVRDRLRTLASVWGEGR
ncbi:hypothetical protein [Streptomyces hokutonensis]|uniref:hypothetical protein n=1 Tax=Streptomyces hokutonensis TaxID=1306990 RepID=UPI0003719E30|nr:hypothetical protein [Streptomyces hokutonensis]